MGKVGRTVRWGAAIGTAAWLAWPLSSALLRGRGLARGPRAVQRRQRPGARVLVVGERAALGRGPDPQRCSVAGRLATAHPDWNIGNLAQAGSRTTDVARVLGRLARRLDRSGPGAFYDAVVIHMGDNDALRFTSQGPLSIALVMALAAAGRVAHHTVLIMGGNLSPTPALPPPWSWVLVWRARRMRELFEAIAWEAGVAYVDLDESTAPPVDDGHEGPAGDRSHPRGARSFAAIDRVLAARIGSSGADVRSMFESAPWDSIPAGPAASVVPCERPRSW